MKLVEVAKKLNSYHKTLLVPRVKQTSVVSPLFPGQFNYCLDEMHIFEKYKNFINIHNDEHFQKIQSAIRLADFDTYFSDSGTKSAYHLGAFTIGTINGGHIKDRKKEEELYRKSVFGVIDFLTKYIGLEKNRLRISYFSGGATAREVEASRKRPDSKLKVETKFRIEEDTLAKTVLLDTGLRVEQLIPNNTRDNFLTTNWDITIAPWGYRNEILYVLDNGNLLDIATIERLIFEPVVENRDGINYVIDIKPWNRCFVIDACGIERVALASSAYENIFEVLDFEAMLNIGLTVAQVESIRILHRVYTDSSWEKMGSENRREKLNNLSRKLNNVAIDNLEKVLSWNFKTYSEIFPELKNGIQDTLREIKDYRRRTNFVDMPVWPRAEFHNADEGFERVVDEIMEEKGEKVFAIISSAMLKTIPEQAKQFRIRRIENKISIKAIVDDESREIREMHKRDKEELREMRFSNKFTHLLNTAIYIYGNKIAMISAAKAGKGGIIIENKEMAEMLRRTFMYIWKSLDKERLFKI